MVIYTEPFLGNVPSLGIMFGDSEFCARISERARSNVAGYMWERRAERIIEGMRISAA